MDFSSSTYAKGADGMAPRSTTRRSFLLRALALTGGASLLAACGPSAPTQPATGVPPAPAGAQPTTGAAQPATPGQPAAKASGPVELSFWYQAQGPTFVPVIKAMVAAFESEHPTIKVRVEEYPTLDMRQKLQPIFTAGGPGPDIVHEGAVVTLSYAHQPYGFIDLTDRVKAANLKSLTPPASWAPLEENGKAYGIPMAAFTYLLAWNQDLYDAAGIKTGPESWDELLANARKITDPQKNTYGFITQTDRFISWPLEILWYDSGVGYFEGSENFLTYDTKKPFSFNNAKGVAALEFLKSLSETAPGGLQGNINQTSPTATTAMSQGNLAHLYTHTIQINQITGQNAKLVGGKNLQVQLFPRGSDKRGVIFSTSVLGIAKGAKDYDAAWEVLRFVSDKWEGQLAPAIGNVPVRQDAKIPADAAGGWLIEPARKALAIQDAVPQPFFPELDNVRNPLSKNVQAYFLGQMSAEQALTATAKDARATMS